MSAQPRRINVAINQATVEALELVMDREGVTLTEAFRRLCGYGDFVYRAVKVDGHDIVMHERGGTTRGLVLL